VSRTPDENGGAGPRSRPDRIDRAEEIFFEALERKRSERPELVAARCGGDGALEREVLSLLEAHEQTGPLDRLQADLAQWSESLIQEEPASAVELPFEPGARLGRYEILERLGAGGMAVVWRARDPRLGRTVAIKMVGHRIARSGQDLFARFEQEARATSALSHPNLITVHDFGEQDGHPFLVMELVEGESLRERLGAPLPAGEIVRLGAQIADGLAAAHDAGVVHRDLKPENVLVDRRGTVRILDFGLAVFRALERQPPDEEGVTDVADSARSDGSGETGETGGRRASGPIFGTVGYAAPEVLRGEASDHRADQFALGAILFEMATGTSAFPADDLARGLAATLDHEPTPVAERRGDLPAPLAAVIDRCLAKRPAERYAETAEILHTLRALDTAGRPGSERSGGAAPGRGRGSLPAPTTPLHGRAREIHRIRGLILEPAVRMVTLTGVGGSGKTRLAIEAARALAADFPGGVAFVPLAGLQEAELVLPTVAGAAGCVEGGELEGLAALRAGLARTGEPILLVLDNFEHLMDAAPTLAELLEQCPEATLLVTSRELLHLRAEHGVEVRPLTVPPPEGDVTPEALGDNAAVALFVERARASQAEFRLTEGNAADVAELCRRLDGLPLALELAAARVRTLTIRSMVGRLADRMGLLTGGPRDLPPRQRTLAATLGWSHGLLDEPEQQAFRRLSVFADGFTLEAAEAVVDPFGGLDRPVVDLIESLHDKSLVQRSADGAEEPRFALLETIREYAAEHLEHWDEVAPTRRAHAAYFLVLAEEAGAAFGEGRGPAWLDRYQAEAANFRAALDWLIETDDATWGMRMAQGLFPFWELGEGLSEGSRRYERLLALPSASEPTTPRGPVGVPLRAKAAFNAGVLAAGQGHATRGLELHRQSLEAYRRLGDRRGQAVALNGLGIQLTGLARYDEARACYDEAMELWRELGESHGAAASLSNFAFVLRNQGELERSRRLYRQAAAMFERLGDPVGAAWEISHEADVALDQRDRPEGGAEEREEAAQLYRAALARFREIEEPWGIGSALVDLGALAQEAGDLETADDSYREALEMFCRVGHQRGVARVLEALAVLAGERGDHPEVLRLAGAVERLRERLGRPPSDPGLEKALDVAVAGAYDRVGSVEGENARRGGREQPIERLLETLRRSQA